MSNPDQLLNDLQGHVQSGNVDKGKAVLNQLKIALLSAPPGDSKAVAALELGVLLAVAEGDLDAFARNMAQLKPSYSAGIASQRKAHITGLNLMHLLVDNRLSEFHSELEWLSESEASDPLISFPISLERQLMVGIYDEVLQKQVPDPSYQFFMDHLLQTVRDSIADCIEVSYPTLKLTDAAAMMKFSGVAELQEYMRDYRDDWIVDPTGNQLTFQPAPTSATAADIPSMQWIQQSLTYATEMERIV
jgi:26S proteasome regulatory subunit N12